MAIQLGLPTVSARRVLEDLAAYGLVERVRGLKSNSPDHWLKTDWMATLDHEPAADETEAMDETESGPKNGAQPLREE